MLLASVADLRDMLGFDEDVTDFTAAATAALHAAEASLTNALSTTFGRETRFDLYYLPHPGYQDGALNLTEFRLRRGFLTADATLVYAGSISALDLDFTTPPVTTHREKGVVTDMETIYSRSFVRISYTSGFEADATDPDSYDLSQVPRWLQEAAKMQALLLLKSSPVLKQTQVEIDADLTTSVLRTQLNERVRYTPTAVLPL